MDGWMDIIRVGVCVGMCKYWVIILDILDILACGGAKCFRGMNPSLILLTSLILPVVLLFSAHHHPPTTHYSPCLQILVVNTHHNGPPRQYGPHHSSGSSPSNHRVHLTHSPTLSLSIRMIDVLEMSSLLAQHRCHSWNRHATRRGLDGHGHGGRPRLGQLAGERHNAAENRPRC